MLGYTEVRDIPDARPLAPWSGKHLCLCTDQGIQSVLSISVGYFDF